MHMRSRNNPNSAVAIVLCLCNNINKHTGVVAPFVIHISNAQKLIVGVIVVVVDVVHTIVIVKSEFGNHLLTTDLATCYVPCTNAAASALQIVTA